MQKKKYDLTSDLINVDLETNADESKINNHTYEQSKKDKNILLTMSVEEGFRAEYKSWCARHRLKMSEAIVKGFQLLKEKYGP
jgi:hypothetical protein